MPRAGGDTATDLLRCLRPVARGPSALRLEPRLPKESAGGPPSANMGKR